MTECYNFSCTEEATHEVTLRDARLTYGEPPTDDTKPYCSDHADSYRDDDRCIVRSLHTGSDRDDGFAEGGGR